eukprot:s1015_g11.t1
MFNPILRGFTCKVGAIQDGTKHAGIFWSKAMQKVACPGGICSTKLFKACSMAHSITHYKLPRKFCPSLDGRKASVKKAKGAWHVFNFTVPPETPAKLLQSQDSSVGKGAGIIPNRGVSCISKHRNGTVMRLDWQRASELSKKKKGQAMDYVECLRILRGESLPEERAQAVDHLFQALGTGDAVSPEELKKRFDASSSPQTLLRRTETITSTIRFEIQNLIETS